jgi:hypothetical protein
VESSVVNVCSTIVSVVIDVHVVGVGLYTCWWLGQTDSEH